MDVGIIYLSFFISSARNSYWLLNNSSSDAAPIESGNVMVMCEPVPEETQPLFPRIGSTLIGKPLSPGFWVEERAARMDSPCKE